MGFGEVRGPDEAHKNSGRVVEGHVQQLQYDLSYLFIDMGNHSGREEHNLKTLIFLIVHPHVACLKVSPRI